MQRGGDGSQEGSKRRLEMEAVGSVVGEMKEVSHVYLVQIWAREWSVRAVPDGRKWLVVEGDGGGQRNQVEWNWWMAERAEVAEMAHPSRQNETSESSVGEENGGE